MCDAAGVDPGVGWSRDSLWDVGEAGDSRGADIVDTGLCCGGEAPVLDGEKLVWWAGADAGCTPG